MNGRNWKFPNCAIKNVACPFRLHIFGTWNNFPSAAPMYGPFQTFRNFRDIHLFSTLWNYYTPETNLAPKNMPPQKENSLPTNIFQGRAVSFRSVVVFRSFSWFSSCHFWKPSSRPSKMSHGLFPWCGSRRLRWRPTRWCHLAWKTPRPMSFFLLVGS